ncbi:hypothetical protein TVAG_482350 [Trichomonas vaginalis G3]|uniref:RING-type domain-containing protein n=1 Tax=Trichomonas vaginalis (strain ATCC PRA-98 / G3) TaxID=412133 RepID=A2EBP4_TRIV3|nr:NEDD8 transferase protein [Trichomonas vaginalis G3]EAY09961.1 hypothetical protein TVAG_482350 [Trichomonas vaginalis G3]KAI5523101.1 NEDD8 transferase protein [Trichomonas vaginalis G3]|eukprot:XP_001322184.1 hypothetical protein [Trichomonas vaginalis G3]
MQDSKPATDLPAGDNKQQPDAKKADNKNQMMFVVYKFNPVYLSSWQGKQDICAICKSSFMSPCSTCESKGLSEPCAATEGKCGHKFHKHCIDQWLQKNKHCPMCNTEFFEQDSTN